jgi:hypothetical protein
MYNSPHFRNIFLYFLVYGGSYVAAMTSILTLGGISGNIYLNLTVINFIEVVIAMFGSYLINFFSIKRLLDIIFMLLAVSYGLYTLVPTLFRFLIVIEGKVLTDFTWILLNTFTVIVSPKKYLPLIMATRAIYNITLSVAMPYIKYFMEAMRLNVFIFSALYEAISWLSVRSIQEMDVLKD